MMRNAPLLCDLQIIRAPDSALQYNAYIIPSVGRFCNQQETFSIYFIEGHLSNCAFCTKMRAIPEEENCFSAYACNVAQNLL